MKKKSIKLLPIFQDKCKSNKAFTLVEVILTAAIISIVFLFLYQSSRFAMNVSKEVNNRVYTDAAKVFNYLAKDIRSTFISLEEKSAIKFLGSSSALDFIVSDVITDNFQGSDLMRCKYYLTENKQGLLTLNRNRVNFFTSKKKDLDEQILTPFVQSLKFSFFDGNKWVSVWNSTQLKPAAVKLEIVLRKNKNAESYKFETTIQIPRS
jgi:prepilin-type N-terminal cleavage/methylation domain-containing protein